MCRRFERTIGGLVGEGCDIRPIPILLALPSRPRAIMVGDVGFVLLVWNGGDDVGRCNAGAYR